MLQQAPPRRRPSTSTTVEHRVLVGALVVGLAHAVDDALLHRQPGVPVDRHLLALVVVVLAAAAAVLVFPRLRPGLRSALALVSGVLVAANGAMHVLQVVLSAARGSDVSGVLAFVAGVVLLGLGAAIPWRHRGERHVTPLRTWALRAGAVAVGLAVAQLLLGPVVIALVQTHKFREAVGAPPPGFTPVSFRSSDGLRLAGWYHPSENGAAVVVVSSAAGDRSGAKEHAAMLARHGYGVLTYDARGTGESDGDPNGWGWEWEHDVAGGLDFLGNRPDVDPGRIGGLGLSTGADVLLEVAAAEPAMRTVVADGATGRSFDDRPPGALDAAFMWTMFGAGQLFAGTRPGPPLAELVEEAAPTPVLLVAAGSLPGELEANARYAAAGSSTTLWRLPEVTHTNALRELPEDYEQRVVDHLDRSLARGAGVT